MEENYIKRLAAAVLELALKDYNSKDEDLRVAAGKWLEEKSRETFGFYWCLEQSEVNPNLVRKYINECDSTRV